MRAVLATLTSLALLSSCGAPTERDERSGSTDGGSNTVAEGDEEPAAMQGMTAAHNAVRAAVDPPAPSPLPPLVWSRSLADVAQAYAERCDFEHSDNGYGENLYATTGRATPQDVVKSWASEVKDFDYESNTCSKVCGHYTQVVWANTRRVGCGVAECTKNSPFSSSQRWYHWVCNYDPPGNYVRQRPY